MLNYSQMTKTLETTEVQFCQQKLRIPQTDHVSKKEVFSGTYNEESEPEEFCTQDILKTKEAGVAMSNLLNECLNGWQNKSSSDVVSGIWYISL